MHNAWANLRAGAALLASLAGGAVGCSSSLDPELEGRSCTADGQCVEGYVCSERVCVSFEAARTAANGGAGRGGSASARTAPAGSVGAQRDGASAGAAPSSQSTGAAGRPSSAAGASAPEGVMDAAPAAGAGGTAERAGPSAPEAGSSAPEANSSAPEAGSPSPAAGSSAPGSHGAGAAAPAPGRTPPATPDPPAAHAGRGEMPMPMGMAMGCNAGLDRCEAACVDLQHNRNHCGRCDKHCNDKSVCIDGRCEKAANAPVAANDIAGLTRILALFGLGLEDLADVLGVEVDDLATTPITLGDLALLGIDEVTLGLVGLGLGTLALLGIELSFD